MSFHSIVKIKNKNLKVGYETLNGNSSSLLPKFMLYIK